MTTLHLLALAGYFLILFEYIAMRHRDICAESDARMDAALCCRAMQTRYITPLTEWGRSLQGKITLLESRHEMTNGNDSAWILVVGFGVIEGLFLLALIGSCVAALKNRKPK